MKTVLITGASSGIGLAAAKTFCDEGWRVFGLCRREYHEEGIEYIRCDVTDEEQVKAAFDELEKKAGSLDILVNCAGMGISGAAVFTEKTAVEKQIAVNFTAVAVVVKHAFPLLEKSRGRIINVSSAAAVFAIPFQSFYSASKAALNSYSKALAGELRRFGISVTALMLGGFMIHGISPGPNLFSTSGVFVYGIFAALAISTIMMLLVELKGIKVFVKVLQVPQYIFLPC